MKTFGFVISCVFCSSFIFSQKNPVTQTSNLNLSKSNINRVVYPSGMMTSAAAQTMLVDLGKANLPEQSKQKAWLVNNFRKYNLDADKIKQIIFFPLRQYEDCTICKKYCKGHCVQDPGADCVCIQHSDPNLLFADPINAGVMPSLKTADPGKAGTLIYLSLSVIDEDPAMELMANTISAQRTNIKSN